MSDQPNQLPAIQQPSRLPCAASILPPPCERLKPAGSKQGTAELLACLTLVCPTGMTGEERGQWVSVARQALTGIPADLLTDGCAKARMTCRFPSEIVPAIMAEVKDRWAARRRAAADEAAAYANRHAPRLTHEREPYASPAEAAAILAQYGLKSLSGREA